MSKLAVGIIALLLVVGLIPFALIAKSRAAPSPNPPIHLVFDMDFQPKMKAQNPADMFADKRAMRPQPAGTVAREDLVLHNETLNLPEGTRPIDNNTQPLVYNSAADYAGIALGRVRPENMSDEQFDALKPPASDADIAKDKNFYIARIPAQIQVTSDFVHRGEERFNVYCAPCHGLTGEGTGPIAQRAAMLQASKPGSVTTFKPQNLQLDIIKSRTDGHLFNTITNGRATMPAYDKQISILDRWAIVAYVRAVQKIEIPKPQPASTPAK